MAHDYALSELICCIILMDPELVQVKPLQLGSLKKVSNSSEKRAQALCWQVVWMLLSDLLICMTHCLSYMSKL